MGNNNDLPSSQPAHPEAVTANMQTSMLTFINMLQNELTEMRSFRTSFTDRLERLDAQVSKLDYTVMRSTVTERRISRLEATVEDTKCTSKRLERLDTQVSKMEYPVMHMKLADKRMSRLEDTVSDNKSAAARLPALELRVSKVANELMDNSLLQNRVDRLETTVHEMKTNLLQTPPKGPYPGNSIANTPHAIPMLKLENVTPGALNTPARKSWKGGDIFNDSDGADSDTMHTLGSTKLKRRPRSSRRPPTPARLSLMQSVESDTQPAPKRRKGPLPAKRRRPLNEISTNTRRPNRALSPGPRGPNRALSPGPRRPNRAQSPGPRRPNRAQSPGPRRSNRALSPGPRRPNRVLSPGLLLSPDREDDVGVAEAKTQDDLSSDVDKGEPNLATEVEHDDGKATVHTDDDGHGYGRNVAAKVECDSNDEVKPSAFNGFRSVGQAARAAEGIVRCREDKEAPLCPDVSDFCCKRCNLEFQRKAKAHPNPAKAYDDLVKKGCLHVAAAKRPQTPEGYWNLTFDDTETQAPPAI